MPRFNVVVLEEKTFVVEASDEAQARDFFEQRTLAEHGDLLINSDKLVLVEPY